MKTREVVDYLNSVFHPEYQEDYDNSGFLLGDGESEYRGALVALDLTPAVVEEAIDAGCYSLIVTHHPFIFKGVRRLTDASETGRMVSALIKHDMAVYAAHTNLDNLMWGVNGALSERLGLSNCHILKPVSLPTPATTEVGAGMVGELKTPMATTDFLLQVKQLVNIPMLRYAGGKKKVRRVALCGGAGGFLIEEAQAAGADIYLTADLKYHDFQRCTDRMVLADIGHYESEQFAKEIIFHTISRKFCNFAVRISERQHSVVQYI